MAPSCGVKAILAQEPTRRPKKLKKSPAPFVHLRPRPCALGTGWGAGGGRGWGAGCQALPQHLRGASRFGKPVELKLRHARHVFHP